MDTWAQSTKGVFRSFSRNSGEKDFLLLQVSLICVEIFLTFQACHFFFHMERDNLRIKLQGVRQDIKNKQSKTNKTPNHEGII